jgi:hypothetical protein
VFFPTYTCVCNGLAVAALLRQRMHMGNWMKYAAWEAGQKEWERARSVYERALDVDYKHQPIWLRYAEVRGCVGALPCCVKARACGRWR